MGGMNATIVVYPTPAPYEQVDFSWMVGRVLREVQRYGGGVWRFVFEKPEYIQTQCLWRIARDNRVILTNEDDGHQFGLPAPIDAAMKASEAFASKSIRTVVLREFTADMLIEFVGGLRLEIIPTSGGYESWEVRGPGAICHVAQGGGQICTWVQPVT
jgi:hypothetical protein